MAIRSYTCYLNVNLAVLTSEAFRTVADVTIHIIFASSAVLTRIRGALVNIDLGSQVTTLQSHQFSVDCHLAAEPREARGTRAVVVGDPVQTRAAIQTRAVPALVPVSLTVVARVAVLTEALVALHPRTLI